MPRVRPGRVRACEHLVAGLRLLAAYDITSRYSMVSTLKNPFPFVFHRKNVYVSAIIRPETMGTKKLSSMKILW
jgi:ferric-dicitrate binding protein FerR (iron transport regulator)